MSNPVNKIIFLIDQPLNKRLYALLGVETLLHNGFDTEVWDLTPFLHKELLERKVIEDREDFDICKKFSNKHDIVASLSSVSPDTIVNSFISYHFQTFFIYHVLSKKNIRYCVAQMISFPLPLRPPQGVSVGFFKSVIKRVLALKPRHVIVGLCNKLLFRYYRILGIRPADLAILSGERSFDIDRDPISEKTRLIWGHAWDYDLYLEERNNPVAPDPYVGVFLDEYFPLHTDLDYLGISSPVGADEYYAKLCTFFDHLEKNFNMRIIIAAHPRSAYPESTNFFGGRQMIKGQTVRLVHESSFVLAHDSTSINFAVLFRKPLLFLTMDKMQKCDAGRLDIGISITSIAGSLQKTPINLDVMNEFDRAHALDVDENAYAKYENDFIKKTGTPEIPFWEIYIQAIRQIYQ